MDKPSKYPAGASPVSNEPGTLWVVATPIGNLRDLTYRAHDTLARAEWIAAEDTRHSQRLLEAYGIRARLISLHEHNEASRLPRLLRTLEGGRSVALISDAGTPLVSDPGARLVQAAAEAGVPVRAVPGASSPMAALSVAGFAAERFLFEGFLPARPAARRSRIAPLAGEVRPVVLFEAPHRIVACLRDLAEAVGEGRRVVVARELTKRHETLLRGALGEVLARIEADPAQQRGEFVVVLEGAPPRAEAEGQDPDAVLRPLLAELPVKQAARLAARILGQRRNALYRRALALKGEGDA